MAPITARPWGRPLNVLTPGDGSSAARFQTLYLHSQWSPEYPWGFDSKTKQPLSFSSFPSVGSAPGDNKAEVMEMLSIIRRVAIHPIHFPIHGENISMIDEMAAANEWTLWTTVRDHTSRKIYWVTDAVPTISSISLDKLISRYGKMKKMWSFPIVAASMARAWTVDRSNNMA